MKIAVALNSHLISEHAALYALRYAQSLGLGVELLHVKNPDDPLKEVQERVARLQIEAGKFHSWCFRPVSFPIPPGT